MAALLPRIATLEAIFTTMPSSGKGRGNNSSKIAEKVSKRRFLFRCVYAPVPCFLGPPKSNAVHVESVPGSTWRIFFLHRPSIPRQPPPERGGRIRSVAAADGHHPPPHPCLRRCIEAHLARFGRAAGPTRHMFQVGQEGVVGVILCHFPKSANGRLQSCRLRDRRMGTTDHCATNATCHSAHGPCDIAVSNSCVCFFFGLSFSFVSCWLEQPDLHDAQINKFILPNHLCNTDPSLFTRRSIDRSSSEMPVPSTSGRIWTRS